MTNLLLGYPDIQQRAVRIDTTGTFSDKTPIHNLRSGERHQIAKLSAASAELVRTDYDVGATTAAANYVAIARADRLKVANISRVVVRGSTVSAFTPSLISGLRGWWDFTRQVTVATGISQISDLSGVGAHMTQGTGASQPAWTAATSGINDNRIATFDGVNDAMSATGTTINVTGAFSAAVVVKPITVTAEPLVFGNGNDAAHHFRLKYYINNRFYFYLGGPANVMTGPIFATGTTYIIIITWDGTTGANGMKLYLDGTTVTTQRTSTLTPSSTANYSFDPSSSGSMGLGEAMIFNKVLSTQEISDVYNYLNSKWKVTAPFKDNSFSSATLYGQNTDDYISTFTTSTAFRHWWVDYEATAAGSLEHSKFYIGSYFDFGKDPDDIKIEKLEPRESKEYSSSGAVQFAKNEQGIYRVSITWNGITDDNIRDFTRNVVNNSYRNKGIFLITTTDHTVLDNQRILHCKLLDYDVEGVKTDWNVVTAVFEEITG